MLNKLIKSAPFILLPMRYWDVKKKKQKKETENQKRVAISTWGSDRVALCKKLGRNPEVLSHGLLILIKSAI